ncbi:MAG: hypothetical protein R3B90_16700 [Planctomycetaceae bacterium]
MESKTLRFPFELLVVLAAFFSGMSVAGAQTTVRPPQPGFRELRVDEVKPAFSVEPVVQRLRARRGQLLTFDFELTSLARTTTIEIRPVAMSQELTGAIGPDLDSPPPAELQITSPSRIELVQDAQLKIEGTLRVPTAESPFHTYGILVTDYGRDLKTTEAAPPPDASRATLQFVTRYLLRIDVEVDGVRPASVGKMELESAELIETLGYPQVRVNVVNVTQSPLEFGLECRLLSETDASLSKAFSLNMPVRSNFEPPDRYLARILPGARIHMEGFVPVALYPGPYELEVTILADRRRWKTVRFPVFVGDNAFPGLATQVASIAQGISASPAQIELSTLRGGNRYQAVTLTNNSANPVEFALNTTDINADTSASLSVRPESLTLQPGGSRKVLVTLGRERPEAANEYGRLTIKARSASGADLGATQLATAVVTLEPSEPNVELGALAWKVDGDLPAIVVPVTNHGDRHIPIDGLLTLTDIDSGNRYEFSGGYGEWLLPGASDELAFRINRPIPSARYELKIIVRQGEGQPTQELKSLIELADHGSAG